MPIADMSAAVLWNHIWVISTFINEMDHTTNTGAAGAIPWRWRILIYTISILGFGNVTMCSWLPAKLRTASIVYHGFFLLVYVFNMIIFLVNLRLSGPLNLMTGKLLYLVIVICGSSLCAGNLWATVMKRPHICFQTWAKCIIGQKKKGTFKPSFCIQLPYERWF